MRGDVLGSEALCGIGRCMQVVGRDLKVKGRYYILAIVT